MTTEENKTDAPESLLTDKEITAIEMKFEGFTYKEIGAKIELEASSIRKWFMTGGKLYDRYVAYAKEEGDLRRAATHDMFKAHLSNATRTLVDVMLHSKIDIARIAASKEVINRQLGEPLKVVVADTEKVNEYLTAINKFKDGEQAVSADVPRGENPSVDEGSG